MAIIDVIFRQLAATTTLRHADAVVDARRSPRSNRLRAFGADHRAAHSTRCSIDLAFAPREQ